MLWLKAEYQQTLDDCVSIQSGCADFCTVCISDYGICSVPRLGSEFAPQLSEGDFAVQQLRSPSTGLEESLRIQGEY